MFLIPMMGESSRFYEAGYTIPKYKLPLWETNLFINSISSFKDYFKKELFIFSIPNDKNEYKWIKDQINYLEIENTKLITFDNKTNGQADTVYQTLKKIDFLKGELNIFNIDTILMDFKKEKFKNCDGYLEVFFGKGNHWSFAKVDKKNLVLSTSEKKRISKYCSNGYYNFKDVNLFIKGFKKQREFNEKNNIGEIYIAPIYNFLIEENYKFKIKLIDNDEIVFSGTPSEYESIKKNERKKP